MNLLEIRTKFRELSGRYDLVNDDFSDNGANFYINEASKWLDKTVETSKSWGSFMSIIAPSTWYLQFPHARAVKECWISTIEGKWQLTKIRLQDLISSFFTKPPTEWTNGTPEYYSPIFTRYIPEDISPATLATFAAYVGIMNQVSGDYNAVIFSAPVDQDTLVEIIGLFYAKLFDGDDDENYWSQCHPMLLIQAAIRQTYVVSGNKPMLDVLDRGIDGELQRLDRDLVEQIIAEVDEMDA